MKESTWIVFRMKVRSGRSQWNYLGFLITIPGIRNVIQSQEVFLMDAKYNFFNFEDRNECYTSSCMFFKGKPIVVLKITYGHHHSCMMKALSGPLKDNQIYFCKFLSYREVWYTNLYVLCKRNLMMWSKLLMEIIIGVKKIPYILGRVSEEQPDLLL